MRYLRNGNVLRTRFWAARVLAVLSLLAFAIPAIPTQSVQAAPDWLDYVNNIRAVEGLPAVTENPALSDGAAKHSKYVVENNNLTHDEDQNQPFYTVEGAKAGKSGNVAAGFGDPNYNFRSAIDGWITGPFHGIGILDPRLTQVGFGIAIKADAAPGAINAGGTLDILSSLNGPAPTNPVTFPANGKTTTFSAYTGGESPDPLSACAGYATPSGAPIYLQFPDVPNVTASTLTKDGGQGNLDLCMYNAATYTNPDAGLQDLGRGVLNQRNAVVLLPKAPLTAGTYRVSVTNNGTAINWSFNVPADGVA